MCKPPGHINTLPGSTTSPFSASFIFISESLSSLSASGPVKPFGICWLIKTAAEKSCGSRVRIIWSAAGPPVDVPMATTSISPIEVSDAAVTPVSTFRSLRFLLNLSMLRFLTPLTLFRRSFSIPRSSADALCVGFAIKSTAPNSRALNTVFVSE